MHNAAITSTHGTMSKQDDKRRQKSAARLYAVQALFQMEASGTGINEIIEEFLAHRFGADVDGDQFEEGNPDHFRGIVENALTHQAKIDQLTDKALVEKWPINRIDPTIRALFRAAGAELVALETPPKVVINEYVDIARAFFPDGKEPKFSNAVLDHIARAIKPEAFAG